MFQKKKAQSVRPSVRVRRPVESTNETFRRNNVVISRRQKEIANRQKSVTQRQIEKKRADAVHKRKIRIIAGLVAVLVALFVFRSITTSVELVSNASTKLTSSERTEYQNQILAYSKKHTVLGQAWLLDTGALTAEVTKKYPEIQRVSYSSNTPFNSALKADVRFRKPVFTWKDVSGQDQFVDQDGVLFSKNLDPTVNVRTLIAIEDQSGVVLEAGSSVLTTDLVQFVGQLHSKLPAVYGQGAQVERVIIPRSTREVHVQMKGNPYLVKFNSTRNLEEQVGELQALLTFMKAGNVTPSAYIDLRVPHKAFYK